MKKYFIALLAATLFAGFVQAQKEVFVAEKQIQKVFKGSKNADWPKSEKIFTENLDAGVCKSGAWSVEKGELSNKGTDPIVIKGVKGNFMVAFEYKLDSDEGEGEFFICAPKGNLEKAIRFKLSNVNADKGENNIASINGKIAPKGKFDEPKGRWVKVFIFVEGDSIRVSQGERICGHYADRNFLTTSIADIEKKLGFEISKNGEAGFICNKGVIKIKNVFVTPIRGA